MNQEQLTHAIYKALEVWGLQNLCDLAILVGFAALALMAARAYLERLKARLTLRVATEIWETATDLGVDILLAGIALVALFLVNMDIMADIKIGLPFVPAAFLLLSVALVIRLFHGGSVVGSKAWMLVLFMMVVAGALNWFGFTYVMEGAGDEYLAAHREAASFWNGLKNLRSNRNPDLTMITFMWTAPALALTFLWAIAMGAIRSTQWARKGKAGSMPKGEAVLD